jgi:flagellar protein FliO/FliZ
MDLLNLFQYATALILVLALALLALLARRYGNNPQAFKQQLSPAKWNKWSKWKFKAPEKRLAVVETLMLGPKQRLIIIRRDNVEHLVVVTADSACVVENNIPASSKLSEAPAP